MTMSIVGLQRPNPAFIGSGGLFNMTSGTITKDYIEAEDRTVYTVNGNLTISNMTIKLQLGISDILGASEIKSQDYVMPIRSGMTVLIKSGSNVTMNQDMLMQPDSKLIIEEGATVTAASGRNIYVYDASDWGKFCYVQYLYGDQTYGPVYYVPTGRWYF